MYQNCGIPVNGVDGKCSFSYCLQCSSEDSKVCHSLPKASAIRKTRFLLCRNKYRAPVIHRARAHFSPPHQVRCTFEFSRLLLFDIYSKQLLVIFRISLFIVKLKTFVTKTHYRSILFEQLRERPLKYSILQFMLAVVPILSLTVLGCGKLWKNHLSLGIERNEIDEAIINFV